MTIPGASGTATFGGAPPTSISMAGAVTVGALQFTAPNYVFNVDASVNINGTGINSSLANAPTFNVVSTVGGTPAINFNNSSSAGTAKFILGQDVDTAGGFNAGFILFTGNSTAGQATITVRDASSVNFFNSSNAGQATLIANNGGFIGFNDQSSGAQATVISNAGGEVGFFGLSTPGTTLGSIAGAGTFTLTSKALTVGSNNTSTEVSGSITGDGGSLVKVGTGTLTLSGINTYTGGTTINAGTLAVNGSLASGVIANINGTLSGVGTINGPVIVSGTIAPGNGPIIGTLNVNGTYTQNAGSTYQVKVGSQSDLINITGNANIKGGTVAAQAVAGVAPKTYTIVTATGGVTGTYSGLTLTPNFAFVTPSLSYDPNNVFLTLRTSFGGGGGTRNEMDVGKVLDQISGSAKGDLGTVVSDLANLDRQHGLLAEDAISGQPWADFGTMNTNNAAMFMNALAQQMANARGAASAGQRQALAQACEIAACDGTGPLSAWASALGGLGSVLGDGNAATLTYNFAGAAVGVDYRFDPRFLVGIGVGYTHGWEWVNSFPGQGYTDSVSVAAYGSFTQSGFYVDALAGYAYYNNQVHRQIVIPGLDERTATGSTGANQFLGQIEGGYKIDVYAPAAATITPFGRFQISSVTQNGFSESGAQSLDLNVFQQTTNSQRTTIGADLAGAIGIGDDRKLNLDFRLGWMHEFADTSRPITAAFAGGPGNAFTVFAAPPGRNSAVLGLSAMANIAAATQLYLRYDGEIATGTDNHAINVGVRFSW
jgi:autotransporter-associated beta strand protein